MNTRGQVINKYLIDKPDKFKQYQKSVRGVGYLHSERMDRIVLDAFILANRPKIAAAAKEGYGKLKTVEEVVQEFYERTPNSFYDACCLDMGFELTDKDFDDSLKGKLYFKLDFSLYIPELDAALVKEVSKTYNSIDSHTLELSL